MKRLLCIVLSLLMLLTAFSIPAFAGTPLVEVIINEETGNVSGTGYSYVASSKTLTLDGAKIGDITITGVDVTITLKNTNTISAIAYGISSNGNITFTGDGNLTVTAGDYSPALTVEGGSKAVTFGGTGALTFKTSNAEAIKVDGIVNFNAGTVTAETSSGMPAVVAYGVTQYDNYNGKAIDSEIGTYDIKIANGLTVTPSGATAKAITGTNSDSYVTEDNYYLGTVTEDDYYLYKKVVSSQDSYDAYIIKYDKYTGEQVDRYPADNATGASWSNTYKYYLKTLATGTPTLSTTDGVWTYKNVLNSVTIQKADDEKITTDVYQLKNAGSTPVIDKIKAGTTVKQFKDNLTNDNVKLKVKDIDGKEVGDSALVGTKYTVELWVNSSLKDTRTLVVLGDVYPQSGATAIGDLLDALDYVRIKNYIMDKDKVLKNDPILKLAADANDDGNIDALDYVRIKNVIMGKVK